MLDSNCVYPYIPLVIGILLVQMYVARNRKL